MSDDRDGATTDPGGRSPETIERDVERTRANLTRTLDELRDRLSPGQVMDQLTEWAKGSGGAEFARNLGAQVRDNPLPILLVGAGIGWLMMSGGGRRTPVGTNAGARMLPGPGHVRDEGWDGRGPLATRRPGARSDAPHAADETGRAGAGSNVTHLRDAAAGMAHRTGGTVAQARDAVGGAAHRAGEAAAGLGDRVGGAASDAAGRVTDAASSAYRGLADASASTVGSARDAAGEAGQRARMAAHDARDYAAETARRAGAMAQQGWAWMVRDQPLVLGAIGLAIGAAIGAALPRSTTEDALLGEASDDLADRAKRVAREGYEAVTERAGEHLGRVQGAVSDAAGEVSDRIGGGAGGARDAAREAGGTLGRVADEVTGAVREALKDAAAEAKEAVQKAGSEQEAAAGASDDRDGREASVAPSDRPAAPPPTGPAPDARRSNPL
jgi:ElaB/YqjD/DUF883 family membrane-anchored ribosome-binding protein